MKTIKLSFYLALFALVLAACTNDKQPLDNALVEVEQPSVQSTLQYIPKREIDKKTGLLAPYIAMPNPYLLQKGRIDKQSVVLFIEARRLFKAKQYDEAKVVLDKLVQADGTLSGPWVMLGDIAELKGDLTQAAEFFSKALTINEVNMNAYIRLAKVQRLQGDFVRAQNVYATALSHWQDFPEAHLNLAILLDVYMNDTATAQRHMEAYQFLTDGKDEQAETWLREMQSRTGLAVELNVEQAPAVSPAT
ncbi:tetratricopeptide repeat protein [Teredinibacter sp. KSP-S5-2]|uniref:tetratricopeptide repeat protein n=1 Tax=Teredinibacter sp. KSP-S5-2 TaxID=3034506 RepID=UPI00293418EF|nr:tetratricopeptide repeat protein [Teredinibacter sp. KSP-S5-2]WNO10723.1 tetratricopeptide repeat protein [Teredinibacter sp. KSP-S5-2]